MLPPPVHPTTTHRGGRRSRMRALLLAAAALAPTPNPTGALDNGLGRDRPALGWSSWNHFSCGIHDSLFRQTADALVASGLRDAGYRYVNIVRAVKAAAKSLQTTA